MRTESLRCVGKVVTAGDGDLELTLEGGGAPLVLRAAAYAEGALGAFFQYLSEFHDEALRARRAAEEEARLIATAAAREAEAERRRAAEAAAAAVEAAKSGARAAREAAAVNATLRGGPLVTAIHGAECLFAVTASEVLFVPPRVPSVETGGAAGSVQRADLAAVRSVRSDGEGRLVIVAGEGGGGGGGGGGGIIVPKDALDMEQLQQVRCGGIVAARKTLQREDEKLVSREDEIRFRSEDAEVVTRENRGGNRAWKNRVKQEGRGLWSKQACFGGDFCAMGRGGVGAGV